MHLSCSHNRHLACKSTYVIIKTWNCIRGNDSSYAYNTVSFIHIWKFTKKKCIYTKVKLNNLYSMNSMDKLSTVILFKSQIRITRCWFSSLVSILCQDFSTAASLFIPEGLWLQFHQYKCILIWIQVRWFTCPLKTFHFFASKKNLGSHENFMWVFEGP